ncbi:hypothetical protein C5F63_06040 [Photobacterium damselae subsp. damselae]|uniref:hypothetical protein n=1 Tax=Photobacterium damselae TaxID=38293 RepID=UPI000D0599F7|nr:hypothetical protein [Photobacterium damselae]PSB89068.1 hypothetical protein C5F63_06040 [Photobacterium damselae subsp. damselae]
MYSRKNSVGFFQPINWGAVKNQLKPVLGTHFEEAQRAVLSGRERVFLINDRTIVLLRAEGYQLVIAGFVGDIEEAAPLIYQQAKSRGFTSIRIHAERRAEQRKLNSMGFNFKLVSTHKCTARNCQEFELVMEI